MTQTERHYDVAVIGAGPAGSMAARKTAEAGYSVLLLEKRQEIGSPVRCAEGVSAKWIEKYTTIRERWISARLKSAVFCSPNGHTAEMRYKETEYILDRKVFDHDLACEAAQAGVTVLTKASVIAINRQDDRFVCTVTGLNDFCFSATIIIAADGVESRIAPMLGVPTVLPLKDLGVCFQYTLENIRIVPEQIEIMGGSDYTPGGYAWIFPKSATSANVGLGMPALLSHKDKNARWYADRLIAKRFPGASIVRTIAGAVPLSRPLKKMYGDGFMITGDAARLANSLTGAGIGNALVSGALAGETAAVALKKGDFSSVALRAYQNAVMDTIGTATERFYPIKEAYVRFTDTDFNTLVRVMRDVDPENISPKMILEIAFRENIKILSIVKKLLIS